MVYDLSRYKLIQVEPLTGSVGAEIFGVDVNELDAAAFAEIKQAFLEFHAIFFRDQQLDPATLSAFGERFGPIVLTPYAVPKEGDGMVVRLQREAEVPRSQRNLGDRWHADQSPREKPNASVALYCYEAPPYGGDTMFANLTMAYEWLSPGMQKMCEGLIGLHSPSGVYGRDGQGGDGGTKKPLVPKGLEGQYKDMYKQLDESTLAMIRHQTEHPVVCTHPETGKPFLYVTGDYMVGIKDMRDLESWPLLEQLNRHVTKPEFTCRFRWKKGSLAVWDNRCLQHYAVNDYAGFARRMMRVEMDGTRPYGPAMPQVSEAASRQKETVDA